MFIWFQWLRGKQILMGAKYASYRRADFQLAFTSVKGRILGVIGN